MDRSVRSFYLWIKGSDGRFRSAQNIQEEISGLPNFTNRTPGQIRQTLRNRGYSSVQAHSGGKFGQKAYQMEILLP